MEAVTQVMFENAERRELARAVLAAFVMYADDVDTMRLLNGIASAQETVSLSRVVRAHDALSALLPFLEMEARQDYWDRKVANMTAYERTMRDVIIEARKQMVVDVKAALRLIEAARRVATHPREVDA